MYALLAYLFKLMFEPTLLLLELNVELALIVVTMFDLGVVGVVVSGFQFAHSPFHQINTENIENNVYLDKRKCRHDFRKT